MTSTDSSELPIRYPRDVLGDMVAGRRKRPKFTRVDTVAGQLSVEALDRGTHWDSPVEEEALMALEEDSVWAVLASDVLFDREREVLALRFGFVTGSPMTLGEIGGIFGLTREGIRKIEARALNKLRHSVWAKNLMSED